jgi:hypothetical protein
VVAGDLGHHAHRNRSAINEVERPLK